MIFITRRERFNAAHRLFSPTWSDEENYQVFGKCANPNFHGHNYELFVTVKGNIHKSTGYCVNLSELSSLLNEKIIKKLDHKNLNLDVDFLQGIIPTSELVAVAIWQQIELPIKGLGAELHCVKLVETENNYVEYYGG